MNGKGSKRRPAMVPMEKVDNEFDRIFRKNGYAVNTEENNQPSNIVKEKANVDKWGDPNWEEYIDD